MEAITLPAHFDGEHIRLDAPYALEPDTKLLVTVLPKRPVEEKQDSCWPVAIAGLGTAYGAEEPDYSLDSLKERNPEYAGS